MLIIVAHNIPEEASEKLSGYGKIIPFKTEKITYPQVASHPDLFFCSGNGKLVVAPNLPEFYFQQLKEEKIDFQTGCKLVGNRYPDTVPYNAVVTNNYLIHSFKHTDPVVLDSFKNLKKIDVEQGYTRCSLLPLPNDTFLTSDKGIEKALKRKGLEVLMVDAENILLPGFEHGFFGGTAGIINGKMFLTGSLSNMKEGEKIKRFIERAAVDIVELYSGPLFDGGSIILL